MDFRRVGTTHDSNKMIDHHSDYGPAQLTLFGAAAIVLLVFAWTFAQ
jgi:hypothetical protein